METESTEVTLEGLAAKRAQKRKDLGLPEKENSTVSQSEIPSMVERVLSRIESNPSPPARLFVPPTKEDKHAADVARRETALRDNLERIGVNVRKYFDDSPATLDTFIAVPDRVARSAARDFVEQFNNRESVGLYLFSKRPGSRLAPGNGKTHLAVAIIRELAMNPELPIEELRFVFVPRLLLEIQDTFDSPERRTLKVVDKYVKPELLVWDDFGAEKLSDFAVRTLYTILYEREGRSNIFTSNLSLDDVEARESYNERLTSRIAGSCRIVELSGPDRRIMRPAS